MTFIIGWWLFCAALAVLWVGMAAFEAGKRRGHALAAQESRQATFAALRAAVEDAATNGERSAAWRVARHALEPRES
jgi:hypothetical protein